MECDIESEIQRGLDAIEAREGVHVLFACESGSRAWGFASKDSDFDVRFLFVRPPNWYLSIDVESRRDVIERPIQGSLDLSGWDLRKALRLLRRSNPPLLEWLGSPIIYREKTAAAEAMRQLARQYHSPVFGAYHYLHMARKNFREYLRGSEVWVKKYFYVLRPLLAVRWIERGLGPVPTEFGKLVEHVVPDPELSAAIRDLIEQKRDGKELDRGARVEPISAFVERELARLEVTSFDKKPPAPPADPFDQAFRAILGEAWPGWTGR